MARIERRSRHREYLAALIERQPCGDQRARSRCRLHHHHAERKPGDQPVARRKIPPRGARAEGLLADRRAAGGDFLIKRGVLLRIDDVDAAGKHRHGPGFQRALMGRRVDAARHARYHHQPGAAELGADPAGEAASRGGGVAGADHGHAPPGHQMGMTDHLDDRRRIGDRRQRAGVIGLAPADQPRAGIGERGEFLLCRRAWHDADRPLAAAAPRQFRRRLERRRRAVEMPKQLEERGGPDVFAADQTQPVEPLGIGEQSRFVGHRARMAAKGRVVNAADAGGVSP